MSLPNPPPLLNYRNSKFLGGKRNSIADSLVVREGFSTMLSYPPDYSLASIQFEHLGTEIVTSQFEFARNICQASRLQQMTSFRTSESIQLLRLYTQTYVHAGELVEIAPNADRRAEEIPF